jgi:hypothetical protein
VPRVGLEPTRENTGKTQVEQADSAPNSALPADLQRVIDAWPILPEPTRRAVLALIGAGS